MLALDQLLTQLEHHRPSHVLLASQTPLSPVEKFATQHQAQLITLSPHSSHPTQLPKQAFGIVFDYLEHLDKPMAFRRIAQWRNLFCKHIWLTVDSEQAQWQFQDFIGLGFQRLGQFSHTTENGGEKLLNAYGYDLDRYNHRRTWNNSRYWANPERWTRR